MSNTPARRKLLMAQALCNIHVFKKKPVPFTTKLRTAGNHSFTRIMRIPIKTKIAAQTPCKIKTILVIYFVRRC